MYTNIKFLLTLPGTCICAAAAETDVEGSEKEFAGSACEGKATLLGTKKTGNRVQCLLSQNSQEALGRWIQISNKEDSDYLFTPMRGGNMPMTTVNYRKLVGKWCERCGWDSKYFGTHSIRRTIPSVIYGATKDLRSCQLILGHRSVSNTALYLGVQQEDAFEQVRKHRI